jgi:hypothetical protein
MKGKYTSVPPFAPLVNVEISWYKTFALLPHRTVGGKWIWLQSCYKRIVWRGDFHIEPFTEYAQLFDLLANNYDP